MLWYKAWLETRWRFFFLVGSIALIWLLPVLVPPLSAAPASAQWVGIQLGSVLLFIFAAIYLAGAGINTQTLYSGTSGFHGSMLFTLSMPVSRVRLLFVRAGLGALQTCALVAILAGYAMFHRPGTTSAPQALLYGVRAIVCTMAVYALSVLLACVLDEMWQFVGAIFVWAGVFLLQSRFTVVARISPLRGMSPASFPVTAAMPWAPLVASIVLAAALLYASVVVLQQKEY